MQTPWRDWQVSTERIFTRSRPASSMAATLASSISSLACTMASFVNGSRMSSSATRPKTRSPSRSMATRARVGHHEDRVEGRDTTDVAVGVAHLLRAELAQHLVGDAVRHLGPDVDHLVVALAVRDEPLVVLVLDLPHGGVGLVEELVL